MHASTADDVTPRLHRPPYQCTQRRLMYARRAVRTREGWLVAA
jgi:hypothetical protein